MRLVSLDYFRGIAILLIVAGHSYGPWEIDSFFERNLANLISGGTALFVFISGFFFHLIYYKNFRYTNFIEKKAKYVLLPYVILSLLGLLYYAISPSALPYRGVLGLEDLNTWLDYLVAAGIYFSSGKVIHSYWFIPFILVVFLLSPLFIYYIRLSKELRLSIFFILLLNSMIIHRPFVDIFAIHSLFYFMPIYMLGIMCSIHREFMNDFIKDRSLFLGLMVLFLSALQALFYEDFGLLQKDNAYLFVGFDINLLQKIAMCFFFLSLFQKYENTDIPFLKLLSASSFAIYFLHPWVLDVFHITGGVDFFHDLSPGIIAFLIIVPIIVVISFILGYGVKKILKNNSRYVTGW